MLMYLILSITGLLGASWHPWRGCPVVEHVGVSQVASWWVGRVKTKPNLFLAEHNFFRSFKVEMANSPDHIFSPIKSSWPSWDCRGCGLESGTLSRFRSMYYQTRLLMLLLHVMMTNESKPTNVFINVTNMKYINLNLSREGEGRAGGRCLPIN